MVDEKAGSQPLAYRIKYYFKSIRLGAPNSTLIRDGKVKTVIIGGRRSIPADEAPRLVREGSE